RPSAQGRPGAVAGLGVWQRAATLRRSSTRQPDTAPSCDTNHLSTMTCITTDCRVAYPTGTRHTRQSRKALLEMSGCRVAVGCGPRHEPSSQVLEMLMVAMRASGLSGCRVPPENSKDIRAAPASAGRGLRLVLPTRREPLRGAGGRLSNRHRGPW